MAETRGDHAVKGNLAVSGDAQVDGDAKFSKGVDAPYLEIIDQKAEGVAGGTFEGSSPAVATWRTRDFTNVIFNDFATSVMSGVEDLLAPDPSPVPGAGGDVTLEKGVYYCEISAPAFNVNEHVARLADVTDNAGAQGATVVLGTTEFSADTSLWRDSVNAAMTVASTGQTRSHITGKFQLTGQRTLEVQHRCSNTQTTDGFGSDGAFYETNNVFTVVKMWLVRDDT